MGRADSEGVLVEVGRFPFHHLDGHDAERPDVDFGTVLLPSHYLGRHPVRGPHHRGTLVLLWSDLGAKPKVSCGRRRGEGEYPR